jgi:hypothetical protein
MGVMCMTMNAHLFLTFRLELGLHSSHGVQLLHLLQLDVPAVCSRRCMDTSKFQQCPSPLSALSDLYTACETCLKRTTVATAGGSAAFATLHCNIATYRKTVFPMGPSHEVMPMQNYCWCPASPALPAGSVRHTSATGDALHAEYLVGICAQHYMFA